MHTGGLRTSKWYRHKNRRVMSRGSRLNSGYEAMSVWDAADRMQEVSPTTVVGFIFMWRLRCRLCLEVLWALQSRVWRCCMGRLSCC